MVADPHDLVNGSSEPYAYGDTAATAVSRYRSDEVKALTRSGGFAPGSGGGGGGGASASSGGQ
jgi:hypothetical protein